MRFAILTFWMWTALSLGAAAAPLAYALDAAASRVGFTVPFGPDQIAGTMPVRSADIALDFQDPSQSRIAADLDVGNAQANFPFATQALRGPRFLDAVQFPSISFVSKTIEVVPDAPSKAILKGDITIRGVTRPVELNVELFRPSDRAQGEREKLIVHLDGAVSRAAFGATGWSDMVGDTVALDLRLQIDLVE